MLKKICSILFILSFLIVIVGCPIPPPEPPEPPEPEPEINKVNEYLRPLATVQRHGYPVFLFTIFMPAQLSIKAVDENEMIKFWDKAAQKDALNGTRFFIVSSSWMGSWEPWVIKPFLKDSHGKFILPDLTEPIEDYINPEWKDMLIRRLKILRDREIFRSIDIWDHCQCHWRPGGAWKEHWINGDNNNKGTSDNPGDIYYYLKSDASAKAKKTGQYVEKFTRYIVNLIWTEEAQYIRPGWNTSLGFNPGNEVPPYKHWHDRIIELIDDEIAKVTPGVKMYRWQKIGSSLPYDNLPAGITEKCLYQLHQVSSLKIYNQLKNQINVNRFMASLDGARNEQGEYFLISKPEAIKLINGILQDNNFGLELRVCHKEEGRLPSASNGWKFNFDVVNLDVSIAVIQEYKKWIE